MKEYQIPNVTFFSPLISRGFSVDLSRNQRDSGDNYQNNFHPGKEM